MQLARFTKLFAGFCVVSGLVLFCALLTNAFSLTNAFPFQNFREGNSSAVKPVPVFLVLIDASLLCLSKTVSSLTIVFFAALCYMFSKTTLRFMSDLESTSTRTESGWAQTKAIEGMLLRLSRTSDVVGALNHTYGSMMSLWYADLTASFLLSIPSSILAVCGGSQLSEYAFALVDITRDMTVFITMTFVASEVAKNVSDSLHYALRVANSTDDRDVDLAFTLLVKILVCHIQDAKVELSGADFFAVDRALINRVLLLVSTFAIIVYQFLA
ncbi:hypothetical protein V5799_028169 [Amblyomma americanum]|uniref:Uncharacterized protein n=1 Tax=Amblyomma americanum TaxID=6943 RepID=A0AAQ4DDM1_AMBAM